MNIEQIKKIIQLFEESGLFSLEVQEGEERISLQRAAEQQSNVYYVTQAEPAAITPNKAPLVAADEGVDFNRIIEVTSPVVGVFYEAPEPGGQPYIKVGDRVQRGDVLCLIEVMKQVTEVTAPQNGQVADICVTNGNVVEFGQTLVKLC